MGLCYKTTRLRPISPLVSIAVSRTARPRRGRQIALVPRGAKIGSMWPLSARLGHAQGQDFAFHDPSPPPLRSPCTPLLQRRAAHMDCCRDNSARSVWRWVRLGDLLDLPLVVRQSLREHQVGIRLRGGVGVGRVQQFLRIPNGVMSLWGRQAWGCKAC